MITPQDAAVLRTSKDSVELKKTAIACASSRDPKDMDLLVELFNSPDFLDRLDSKEQYQDGYIALRLASVIRRLMENRDPAADGAILQLINAANYQAHLYRIELLICALQVVNPSPQPAINYWDQKSKPKDSLTGEVLQALCINQSPPAMALLERKFLDMGHKANLKVYCMRELILPRRNDAPLLGFCERLLTTTLPPELKTSVVEALFDYQPDEWYRDCSPPVPPERALAARPAKDILRRIGNYAIINVAMADALKASVKLALKELGNATQP